MAKHIYLCIPTFSSPDMSMNHTIFFPDTFHVCLLPLEIWMHWLGGAQALQKGVGTNGGPGQWCCLWCLFVLQSRQSISICIFRLQWEFCENSLLAVMTGNFKDALSLLQADVCVANYKVMHNIYDGEIYCWHATRFWFAPGTSSRITSAFYVNRMILFFIPTDSKSKNVVNVLDKIY